MTVWEERTTAPSVSVFVRDTERERERERERRGSRFTNFSRRHSPTKTRDIKLIFKYSQSKRGLASLPTGPSTQSAASSLFRTAHAFFRAFVARWFLVLGRRRRRHEQLIDNFAKLDYKNSGSSPLLFFHRMFASFRCLHFSFMHVFFSPPPEDAAWGGKAARLE